MKGTYVSLEPSTKIVQNWAVSTPAWPSGIQYFFFQKCITSLIHSYTKEHSAILTITLDQSTDSTKMTLSLDGVPTGMQDEIKRNLEGY